MIPQQGLASLPQAQQGPMQGGPMQGPMPGQAPMQQMPGMMPQQGAPTPGAMTGSLKNMPLEQLRMLYQNPQPGSPPLWAVISALAEKQKEAQAMQAAQGQQVMAQNQQMQQQPPVAAQVVQAAEQMGEPVMAAQGGMMQGYAGGGAVAFTSGGDVAVQRILKKSPYERTPEENEILRAAGVELTQRTLPQEGGIGALNRLLETPFLRRMFTGDAYKLSPEELAKRNDTGATTERIFRGLGGNQFVEPTSAPTPAGSAITGTRQGKSGIADIDIGPSMAPVAPPMQPARRPPAGNKPPAMSQGLGSFVEQTGTPAPDTLSDIESGGIRDIKALQDVLAKQGTTDPELMKLREAAYKSSQDIAARRERDRQAMLEAGQKQYEDISDLIIGAAGGARGKTFGEVLSGAVGGAGAARTAKRAEFQKVKDAARQEQNAIDQLNQALADKRVADRSGDVSKIEAANRAVAEAQLKVTDLRSGIQKERALEADRAEQRKIAREQIANQLKVAQIGAAAKERPATLNPYQKAQLYEKATDNVRGDKMLVAKVQAAKAEAQKAGRPFDENAFVVGLIEDQYREMMVAAGETPPPRKTQPSTSTSMPPGNWGKAQVVTP